MPDADKQPYVEDALDDDDYPIPDSKSRNSSVPPSAKEEANVSRTRNKDNKLRRGGSASPTKDLVRDDDGDDDDDSDFRSESAAVACRSSPIKRESKRSREAKDNKDKDKEREKEKSKVKRKSVTYNEQPRPQPGRAKTTPSLAIQTASSAAPASPSARRQFEHAPSPIITAAGGTTSRPQAYTAHTAPRVAPMSYYGSPGSVSRPPLSNSRYHYPPSGQPAAAAAAAAAAALGTSFPGPHSPFPLPSPMYLPPTAPPYTGHYPPPQAFSPGQGFAHPHPHPHLHQPPQLQHDYFNQPGPRAQTLRYEYRRPRSAMGHRPANAAYGRDYDDDLEDGGGGAPAVVRSPSIKKRPSTRQQQQQQQQYEEERKLMPPPRMIRRPSTSIPAHSPFSAPPPRKTNRASISSNASMEFLHDTDSLDDNESQYSPSEQSRSTDWRPLSVRRPNIDPSAYDIESRYEWASPDSRHHRRNSYRGGGTIRAQSTERDYEDKFHHAQRYQEKYDGPTNQLTADTLRKITRTPSQKTKSTGSRGNDSYALTARNSIDTEDMRILVKGAATFTIGDTHMAVQDGAEIRIPTTNGGGGGGDRTSRGAGGGGGGGGGSGSNGSDTTYDNDRRLVDDRRTRVDYGRPQQQQQQSRRASSRPASHVRGLPAPGGGYYAQTPPTEYSGHGGQYGGYVQQAMYAPHSGYPYPNPM